MLFFFNKIVHPFTRDRDSVEIMIVASYYNSHYIILIRSMVFKNYITCRF